jgi:hypothetical protein
MPRLLPFDALEGPKARTRWTALLAAALAVTAWHTSDAYDSGLWPSGSASSWSHPAPTCEPEPGVYFRLDDRHLTDRYADSARHSVGAETPHLPAYPVENRLVLPACTPLDNDHFDEATALEPHRETTLVPLASWIEFNASTTEPQPLRTAVAVDVRSCDTDIRTCSSDPASPDPTSTANDGTAGHWLTELLHPEP